MPSSVQPRVLCVDDNADACEMLSVLLKHSDIEALCVGSAGGALRMIQAQHFDLFLLDVVLPDFDGFELCRRIRSFDRLTPILFYSGAAYETDKQQGIKAGANAYLIKPDVDSLVKTIMHFVNAADKPVAAGASAGVERSYGLR